MAWKSDIPSFVLDEETLARRIKAGRALADMSQDELKRRLEKDGLGVEDVGRLERPTDRHKRPPEFSLKHLHALSKHLDLPEAWFREPDYAQLFRDGGPIEEVEELTRRFDWLVAELELEEAERESRDREDPQSDAADG